jgi:hypothetical protein
MRVRGLTSRRRVAALGAAALALLAIPAIALAGPTGKPTFHDHNLNDAGVDDDFCGTGETVVFEGRINFKGWVGETGGDPEQVVKATFNYRYTLTNPANGAAVIDSAAGRDLNTIVSGQEGGEHTHEITARGLRGKLQLANGRVLLRDAGNVTFRTFFDENGEFTGLEILRVSGPHPGLENQDAWCEAATEALGF